MHIKHLYARAQCSEDAYQIANKSFLYPTLQIVVVFYTRLRQLKFTFFLLLLSSSILVACADRHDPLDFKSRFTSIDDIISEYNRQTCEAIRENRASDVERFLDTPYVKADDLCGGSTGAPFVAWASDRANCAVETLRVLINRGADVNAYRPSGSRTRMLFDISPSINCPFTSIKNMIFDAIDAGLRTNEKACQWEGNCSRAYPNQGFAWIPYCKGYESYGGQQIYIDIFQKAIDNGLDVQMRRYDGKTIFDWTRETADPCNWFIEHFERL